VSSIEGKISSMSGNDENTPVKKVIHEEKDYEDGTVRILNKAKNLIMEGTVTKV